MGEKGEEDEIIESGNEKADEVPKEATDVDGVAETSTVNQLRQDIHGASEPQARWPSEQCRARLAEAMKGEEKVNQERREATRSWRKGWRCRVRSCGFLTHLWGWGFWVRLGHLHQAVRLAT